ncbi:MAG: ATP-binding cassette domain-containing protein [Actinomycetota bacterium]
MTRLAGSDTREAAATRTVALSARAAMLVGGVLIASVLGLGPAWEDTLDIALPLPALIAAMAAAVMGMAVWRVTRRRLQDADPRVLGASPLIAAAVFGATFAFDGQPRLVALALPAVILLSAAVLADLCATAAASVPTASRSAAIGITLVGGLAGLITATHLTLVASGAGLPRAAGWAAAELAVAAWLYSSLERSAGRDRARLARRPDAPAGSRLLELRGGSVSFGANQVLNGAELSLDRGEFVALVGGNGSGKSTLLRVLAGLTPADDGRVWLDGDEITMLRADERAAAGLALVSGARPIFPDLSIEQNLRCAAYRTHRGADLDRATDALLELVPTLRQRRSAKAGVLSGGEQRLLAVIATLYRSPSVLLADELTLGLDRQARAAVLDLLRALADDGIAVIAVDHDLVSLLARADRAEVLTDGRLTRFDEPARVLEVRRDLLPATFLAGVEG